MNKEAKYGVLITLKSVIYFEFDTDETDLAKRIGPGKGYEEIFTGPLNGWYFAPEDGSTIVVGYQVMHIKVNIADEGDKIVFNAIADEIDFPVKYDYVTGFGKYRVFHSY